MVSRLVRLILLCMALAACASRPPVALPELQIPAADPLLSSPAESLWHQALAARERGDLPAADRLLERAVSLAPDSSWLYREQAELRLRQGDPVAAEGLAQKALRLAPDDSLHRAALWQLVATARLRQGNQEGARAAREKAALVSSQN